MSRSWRIWAVFALCLLAASAAVAWMSVLLLRLDDAEARARREALLEENVRLALWRMHAVLAPHIGRESARPYFAYSAFYPADSAYARVFAEMNRADLWEPSPLLTEPTPLVRLHFQCGPRGEFSSPQVPLPGLPIAGQDALVATERVETAARLLDELRTRVSRDVLVTALAAEEPPRTPSADLLSRAENENSAQAESPPSQVARSYAERQIRQQAAMEQQMNVGILAPPSGVSVGLLKPVWLGDVLLLARRVALNGSEYIQGCWLDWPAIRERLVQEVRDLLPAADVQPAIGENDEPGHLLDTLPVRLVPGSPPAEAAKRVTPIRASITVVWVCLGLAGAAVAALLAGVVSLSERRGAFVSAVTHELRTPLTTFRMYAEMLAEGMVPDEQQRRTYLSTLRAEAERLHHLVENVLAYARLERGRHGGRVEDIAASDLLARVRERLIGRAAQAGMRLEVTIPDGVPVRIRTDPAAVEQILFNLVDNACKYAGTGAAREIHIEAGCQGGAAVLKVRDYGPGIPAAAARRLFRPFSKSAHDAANSAPGVGLGLALSRRLARSMGGDLRLNAQVADGACFVLTLPAA